MIQLERKITMKKADVIKVLQKNKATHIKEYAKAVIGFKQKGVTALNKELKAIKAGKLNLYVTLISPVDRTEEFNVAIGMFVNEVMATVELTKQEYNEYILDRSNMAITAGTSNASYLNVKSKFRR